MYLYSSTLLPVLCHALCWALILHSPGQGVHRPSSSPLVAERAVCSTPALVALTRAQHACAVAVAVVQSFTVSGGV
jgi:hypothetical protein